MARLLYIRFMTTQKTLRSLPDIHTTYIQADAAGVAILNLYSALYPASIVYYLTT